LAAEIKNQLGIESELVRGSGGIFVVTAGDQKLFSKKEEGRFPTEREIIEKLRALT
jgi:selT/selW/selH-like putative selenoprotein